MFRLNVKVNNKKKFDNDVKINRQLKFVVENYNRNQFNRKTLNLIKNKKLFELFNCRNLKLTKLF